MDFPFFRFLRRRLLQVIPVVLGIAMLNFLILQLAPGDVVDVLVGEAGGATAEYMERLRSSFGLDQPVHVQFLKYIGNRFDVCLLLFFTLFHLAYNIVVNLWFRIF